MAADELPPFLQHMLQLPAFPAHLGRASFEVIGNPRHPWSRFGHKLRQQREDRSPEPSDHSLPAIIFSSFTGQCFVAIRGERSLFSKNFGSNLRVCGHFESREFNFHAPKFYCRLEPGWRDG